MKKNYRAIGIMSGTSLDGLDLAYCHFHLDNNEWKYSIRERATIPYSKAWQKRLSEADTLQAGDFGKLNVDYGHYIGKTVAKFIKKNKLSPELIASHGHTIFHQPANKFTVQIGSGAAIAAETGCTVVCDFRSTDVALCGQGAPLVPIGDELLFGDFDACLNIGGIANLSFRSGNNRIAYDICPANLVLNHLAKNEGFEYDEDGDIARKGQLSPDLLEKLNSLSYYTLSPPKSLGKEWVQQFFLSLIDDTSLPNTTLLRTTTEHIALQIANSIKSSCAKYPYVTGGGAYNTFLVGRINDLLGKKLLIPCEMMIEFKEAFIFAFLGVLRLRNEVNCLSSATGASRDCCGGAVYLGKELRL
jgi:anhydro-N-acetylmuramic acid kinase